MSNLPSGVEWSPADNPHAIAVSEATWWRCAVNLSVARLDDANDQRAAPCSSQQIDARNLVLALVQLLAAEQLVEQKALRGFGINPTVAEVLCQARGRYLQVLPDIQAMRNALVHFNEWAVGEGRGLQKDGVRAGSEPRDVSGHYWAFGYHHEERVVVLGPLKIEVANAAPAAADLAGAIYTAACEVDRQRDVS